MAVKTTAKAFISGYDYRQELSLEAGVYTLMAKVKSMYGNVVSFALRDKDGWKDYDLDTVQGEWKWAYVTFRTLKEVKEINLISRYYSVANPVYVVAPQLIAGNAPVNAGASPFDLDQVTDDLHDFIQGIEDFTNEEFHDRVIDAGERVSLTHDLDNVNIIVESVTSSYLKVKDNPFIETDVRQSLASTYDAFMLAWESQLEPKGLKTVILEIIAGDDIITDVEMLAKDNALAAFNQALNAYNTIEKSIVGMRGIDGNGVEFIFYPSTDGLNPPPVPDSDESGYQNDEYLGIEGSGWVDEPLEATEDVPFVWMAERKKVKGVWNPFFPAVKWSKWVIDGRDAISIILSQESHTYKSDLNGDPISIGSGASKIQVKYGGVKVPYASSAIGANIGASKFGIISLTTSNGMTAEILADGVDLSISPTSMTVDSAVATVVIGVNIDDEVFEFEKTVDYTIQFDGADGKSTEFIFKGDTSDTIAPTLPSTSQQDDWYGQGTANEWSDDLVEPTKTLPYVWASQRKKVDGVWGAFTTPKVWLRYAEDGDDAKSIHLNPSAKAISITKGNIPVPTSVTVVGTAVNTTIQYWYYSENGATSFISTEPTGVTRIGNQVTINSATAKFKTLSIKARNSSDDVEDVVTITRGGGAPYVDETTNTWWEWDEELGAYKDTGMSPAGSEGAIPYPAGYYQSNIWYRRINGYAPYVQDGEDIYILKKDTPSYGIPPSNDEYWDSMVVWQSVFFSTLVAKFAQIGGAVFTGDTAQTASGIRGRLISERGVDGTANFQNYTGDSGAWQPKLMLDFKGGELKATSGKIGGIKINDNSLGVASPDPNAPSITEGIYFDNATLKLWRSASQSNKSILITSDGVELVSYSISGSYSVKLETDKITVSSNIAGYGESILEIRPDGIYINGQPFTGGGGGYVLPTATASTLGGIKVGSNLSISNGVLSATNTTYGLASTSSNGLMSSSDKTKLNGIASGANNYSHPSTHPASMITAGTLQGKVVANNNTDQAKQVRNIILSTGDAVASSMENGDIWIKHE